MLEVLYLLLSFGLGAILASFAGVISERLNTGEAWTHGRSRCNSCTRPLDGSDLVPIVSWLVTAGRCRTCRATVPYLYPLTELIVGTLFLATYVKFGLSLQSLALGIFLFVLTIIVLYDLRHTIVPFSLSLVLIVLGGLFAWLSASTPHQLGAVVLTSGVIGLGFFLLHVISSGRWMGLGDAPIALALSLVAGKYAVAGLLFSFWIGAAIGIVILVLARKGHRMGIEVAFVPFLAAGYLLAFFTQWNPLNFL